MRSLRERWREEKPESVILVGCVLAFGGNYGFLAATILAAEPSAWAAPAIASSVGIGLSVLIAWILARGIRRTPKRFGGLGLLASIIVLLSWPGVLGGGVALLGATWGVLTTYEGR